MELTKAHVEKLAMIFRDAKPVDSALQPVTMQQAIKMLSKEIRELRKRGYSWDGIVKLFEAGGVTISSTTLKNYVTRTGARRKGPEAMPAATGGDNAASATIKARRLAEKAKEAKSQERATRRSSFNIEADTQDI
ncbi:MAG TPA: hypothetical protein VMK12_32590 [Anaeromyxobacteraceae bacterium]|nr:hypothetical protein [Anaeromyxobacteraceae bacterium]